MKKNYFLILASAILFAIPFTSCGGDNNSGGGDDPKAPVVMPEPSTAKWATSVAISGDDAIIPEGDDPLEEPRMILATFEASEDSKAIIGGPHAGFMSPAKAKKKAGSADFVYRIYDYTVSGNVYTLKGFGTITIEGSGKSVTLIVKPLNGEELRAEGNVQSTINADDATTNLCRNWSVSKTRISVKLGVSVAQDFTGCNITEIVDYLTNRGVDLSKVDNDLRITNITFTKAGTILITYANKDVDLGKWQWTNKANGEIAYSWNSPDMGNPLTQAKIGGIVEFKSSNTCDLSLGADVTADNATYRATMKLSLKD